MESNQRPHKHRTGALATKGRRLYQPYTYSKAMQYAYCLLKQQFAGSNIALKHEHSQGIHITDELWCSSPFRQHECSQGIHIIPLMFLTLPSNVRLSLIVWEFKQLLECLSEIGASLNWLNVLCSWSSTHIFQIFPKHTVTIFH